MIQPGSAQNFWTFTAQGAKHAVNLYFEPLKLRRSQVRSTARRRTRNARRRTRIAFGSQSLVALVVIFCGCVLTFMSGKASIALIGSALSVLGVLRFVLMDSEASEKKRRKRSNGPPPHISRARDAA